MTLDIANQECYNYPVLFVCFLSFKYIVGNGRIVQIGAIGEKYV